MSKDEVILGISASHDESACILRNGKLEIAIQLERITRRKHDGQGFLYSRAAADYCLQALGLTADEVDIFAFNSQPLTPGHVGLSLPTHDAAFDLFDPFSERAVFVSHHLAHAFATFFCSPFDASTVIIADGSGGRTADGGDLLLRGPELRRYLRQPMDSLAVHVASTYSFDLHGARLLHRETAPSFNIFSGSGSAGEVYAAVSQYVFGSWHDSGKVMGLAPYGTADGLPSLLHEEDGRLSFNRTWQNRFRNTTQPKDPMNCKDLAARVQEDFERMLLTRVRSALRQSGNPDLAYGGGLALNICANERIARESGARSLFILPASHDSGNAIGAAAAARCLLRGNTTRVAVTSDFLGKDYSEAAHDAAILRHRRHLCVERWNEDVLVERLMRGETLGWFQGASEFGPRALGHRSILAAPHDKETWLRINQQVKFREDFRPFAPVVPWEDAARFFHITAPSPFMLRAIRVREEAVQHLNAVTHVDGTARVQTLTREAEPRLHALLYAYGRRSAFPILLNTSLNVRGAPIVETPDEAVEMLLSTRLDALVLGERLLTVLRPDRPVVECVLAIAPCVELVHRRMYDGRSFRLIALARGRKERNLPRWAFELCAALDGFTPLGPLLAQHVPTDTQEEAGKVIQELLDERLLLPCIEGGA